MLDQRIKGCLETFAFILGLSNFLLFMAYYLAERQFGLYSSLADRTTLAYLLAVPISILFSRSTLRENVRLAFTPSLWKSGVASFRIFILQSFTIFGIYFLLKDVSLSRAFLLGYLSLCLILNLVLIYTLPTLISTVFFKKSAQMGAVIFGFGQLPVQLRYYIKRVSGVGINFLGYYADEQLHLPDIEWLGTTDNLLDYEGNRKRLRIELVYAFCNKPQCMDKFRKGIDHCTRRGARVHLYSDFSSLFHEPVRVETDSDMIFLTFFDEPLQNPLNQFLKRVLDIMVALPMVLFVLPPLALLIWLAQQIQSPGPLLFQQTRYGINRRPFTILKFRTMNLQKESDEAKQATRHDSRVFAFGKFLRKTSLDEFPQFLNVLRGEMSVVGPRPHLTIHDDEFEQYFERYRSRHYVKPGITGLAQVSGYRGEVREEAAIIGRVERDIRYIVTWTLGLDVYIILKTSWQVFSPPKSAF